MPRLSACDERGFTLIELLVSMTLGLLVLGGVGKLVGVSEGAGKRVADRVDAQQRGRTAMDQLQQPLRAMTCLPAPATDPENGIPPVASGTADAVTFFANLQGATNGVVSDENGDGDPTYDPDKRRLRFVANGARMDVVLDRWSGTQPTFATAEPSRTLVTDVSRIVDGGVQRPFLRYYRLVIDETTGAESYSLLSDAQVAANPGLVVRVDISFRANPTAASKFARNSVDLVSSVYARTVNREAVNEGALANDETDDVLEPDFGCG